MVLPGDIICYYDYPFQDGTKQNKLFIVLCEPNNESTCLSAIITSQKRRFHGALTGCNFGKKVFLILKKDETVFFEDSFVLRDKIYPMEIDRLFTRCQSGVIKKIGKISSDCFKKLLDCLKLFKQDIATEHWNLIFSKN
jgi:hypothetical protein